MSNIYERRQHGLVNFQVTISMAINSWPVLLPTARGLRSKEPSCLLGWDVTETPATLGRCQVWVRRGRGESSENDPLAVRYYLFPEEKAWLRQKRERSRLTWEVKRDFAIHSGAVPGQTRTNSFLGMIRSSMEGE